MFNNFLAATTAHDVYFGFCITFFVMMILASIFMIVVVIMQQGTGNDMSAITGGTDSFFSKNKMSTLEGKLRLCTVIATCVMLVASILFFVFLALNNAL